ncbi:dTDP-4-dehydrorhamnose reductase [Paenibacillus xanthanilyticus]|uniref:dTDP-4-dehydrorhamnose reductase n=1 Tax=Paenibacillus xanthanilyticus TaxID=1783531 RepID=A0ABV8KB64_9BACL
MAKGKALVTGAQGQLGQDLVAALTKLGYEVKGCGRAELDITNYEETKAIIYGFRPDVIVHAAAYTKVDQAETDQETAYQVNAYGSRNLAVVAENAGAKLVYVSTDYVFNGQGTEPYDEFQPTMPINVYGRTKLAGEQFAQQFCSKHFIVRTSWVYGPNGANFVKTMLKLADERDTISVVSDQVGCPTFTHDLVDTICNLVETEKYGLYHVSNAGHCSWYEFAQAIFELAGKPVTVEPVGTDQFPRPAKRPSYSVFDHKALAYNGFPPMRHWKDALAEFIRNYA